jgi:cell division protein FtsI (penicillin-binding protein 3)
MNIAEPPHAGLRLIRWLRTTVRVRPAAGDSVRSVAATTVPNGRRRERVVVSLVGLVTLVLVVRLVQLQGVSSSGLAGSANRQRVVIEELTPRPGDIWDRHGRLLATSLCRQSVFVIPSKIRDPQRFAERVAPILGLSVSGLVDRIKAQSQRHFVWLARRLGSEAIEQLHAADLPADTWGWRAEYIRVYPQGPVAAHVLGLRDVDNVGRGGLEAQYDHELSGTAGRRRLTRDARGKVIDVRDDPDQPVVHGQDITITIDTVIQLFAERELDRLMQNWKPDSCCAVVLDPLTGEVLAMASRPTFDPNEPDRAPEDAWKNRAIADIYEPGSTFKPLVVGYGLDRRLIGRDETFHCEWGAYRMGRRVLHDHHRYGELSLVDVLVKSSNIGMAKVGQRLTNAGLRDAATLFGFGRRTGIDLPGELPGILRPLEAWTAYSTGSIPMGHEIATTPLQLITAHAALANGGQLIQPRLRRDGRHERQGRWESTELSPPVVQATIAPEMARWVVEQPLRDVVVRGTGRKAQLSQYAVFGKTGTAQSLDEQGGYRSGKYIASFVGGAPVEQPRVMAVVVVNQANTGGETFGGIVAAPAVAELLQQSLLTLRVPPSDQQSPVLQFPPESWDNLDDRVAATNDPSPEASEPVGTDSPTAVPAELSEAESAAPVRQ